MSINKYYVKRMFDIIVSSSGLLLLSPIFLILSLLIIINMGWPILFIQNRVGLNGKVFKMMKFRTMQHSHDGCTVSVAGESRITPIGKILRKYKLDELPELINVLKGEMSIVGPRPDVPGYADLLVGEERKILKMRPGITGPASIKYRKEEFLLATQENPIKYNDEFIFPDKVKINLKYYYNNNIWIDIKLIWKTLF